jgi:hypothetical protein
MIWFARIYFGVMLALLASIGVLGLVSPHELAARFDLLPKSAKGLAELRGLYGGAFVSWALLGIAAWRCRTLRPGLLIGLAVTLGLLAAARLVSLFVDGEPEFNVPALVTEALFALAAWALYRHDKRAA